jgi:SAM-dependent methyltransferase
MSEENKAQFIREFSQALRNGSFVKATFGQYRGSDPQLKKLLVRLIETKRGQRLFVLYRYETRDTAKNYAISEGLSLLDSILGDDFFAGHLFTTDSDFQLDIGKKGRARLNKAKPTFKQKPTLSHNRDKKRFISPDGSYLKALGITTDDGKVRIPQQNKWKQINKFVEIMAALLEESGFPKDKQLKLVDMGCGKGYLTFAVYDYFRNTLGLNISVTGVDSNPRLMELCQSIADSNEFEGLSFNTGSIFDADIESADILVALHACDTATDDALFKGISTHAELIVASPCCHKELRPQIKPSQLFTEILKHGTLLEKQSELLTDGLRSLLLQEQGYLTKVFEFVPTEHTPKNNLITAILGHKDAGREKAFRTQIDGLMNEFGIEQQRLDTLLKM